MNRSLAAAWDFDRLEDLVLLVLGDEFANSESEFVPLATLRERIPRFGVNPLREAIRGLRERQMITLRTETRPVGPLGILANQVREVEVAEYRVTRQGILSLKGFNEVYASALWEELAEDSVPPAETTNTLDCWEPLQIDRSGTSFDEMAEATNAAIERIEGDNGYASTQPEERSRILTSLRTGLESVRAGWASTYAVRALLLQPLRYLSEKFSGTAIGELTKRAFEAVWKWFVGT